MRRPRLIAALAVLIAAAGTGIVLFVVGGDDNEGVRLTTVHDTTGAFSTEVPEEWTDVATTPTQIGGRDTPYIRAAPDLEAYERRADAPGMEAIRIEGLGRDAVRPVLEETAERLRPTEQCDTEREERVSRNAHEGLAGVYTGCGDADAEIWLYVLVAPSENELLVLGVQAASTGERAAVLDALTS